MTVRTIPLDPIVCVLRKPFELLTNGETVPLPDRKTGELVHVAEAVVPGHVTFRGTDDRPTTVRLKQVGGRCPELAANTVIRLLGPRLTSWYTPQARGAAAKSAVTIAVEGVEAAHNGEVPAMRGGLPAHTGGIGAMFLGGTERKVGDRTVYHLDVMFDASGVFAVEGIAEVISSSSAPVELLAQQVTIVGLRAFFTQPDERDVGRNTKAELFLACSGIERAGQTPSNGRTRRAEPTPEQTPADA